MQEAANSSVVVPLLLENIFQRFSCIEDNNNHIEHLLLDLDKLLGRHLVAAALNILDHQSIVVYTNSTKTIEIAETCDSKYPVRFVRFFLHINYCTCEYFQDRVLIKKNSFTDQYTCQHILAARLAIALQHGCLCFKEVTTHDLDAILASFIPSRLQEE